MRTRIFALALLPALLPTLICTAPPLAADATSFDPTKVQITAKATSSIPVGTVVTWPSGANPADMQNPDGTYNWLECNGQSISQTVYPELFAVIGAKVPDYRGLFLRGQGGNSEALGVVQNDMVGMHEHVVAIPNAEGFGSGIPALDEADSPHGNATFATSGGNGMGNETRPVNTAVRYFIRARP